MSRRDALLKEAADKVSGGRDLEYGGPEDSFSVIADLWSTWLGLPINPTDVAGMMSLLKLARLKKDPQHRDSIVDLAGYAACWAEFIPGSIADAVWVGDDDTCDVCGGSSYAGAVCSPCTADFNPNIVLGGQDA